MVWGVVGCECLLMTDAPARRPNPQPPCMRALPSHATAVCCTGVSPVQEPKGAVVNGQPQDGHVVGVEDPVAPPHTHPRSHRLGGAAADLCVPICHHIAALCACACVCVCVCVRVRERVVCGAECFKLLCQADTRAHAHPSLTQPTPAHLFRRYLIPPLKTGGSSMRHPCVIKVHPERR